MSLFGLQSITIRVSGLPLLQSGNFKAFKRQWGNWNIWGLKIFLASKSKKSLLNNPDIVQLGLGLSWTLK